MISICKKPIIAFLIFALPSFILSAMPNITTEYGINLEQKVRAKVINKTNKDIVCYLAIDGHKLKFKLGPYQQSRWYNATDVRYKYTDFSTWCGFKEQYPNFF